MKLIVFPVLFFLSTLSCLADTITISGKFMLPEIDQAELVLLYGDRHYKIPSYKISGDADGKFSENIPLKHSVFAMLKYNNSERKILLTPGRSINIVFNNKENGLFTIEGKGAEENNILANTVIQQAPEFAMGKWDPESGSFIEEFPYTKLDVEGFNKKIMQQISEEILKTEKNLDASELPDYLKKIIKSELRYAYQGYLNDFSTNMLRRVKNPAADSLNQLIIDWQPMPEGSHLKTGFYANMAMDFHINNKFLKLVKNSKGGNPYEIIADFLGSSIQTIDSLVSLYGENPVLPWLFARSQLPEDAQEKLLFNKILYAAHNDYPSVLKYLTEIQSKYFPDSYYRDFSKSYLEDINKKLSAAKDNKAIKFHNADTLLSIEKITSAYKGKIIYLDIWGIWCGPCRVEMEYTTGLKERFKNREDIVFLYLHMDDDVKIPEWKEYVYLKNIEGEHYHMNNNKIQPIWEEIKAAGGKTNIYPTYIIISREGNIISTTAERPSSAEKLYNQLEKILEEK